MKIAIIGCGNIGSAIARSLEEGHIPARLAGVFDIDRERAERLASSLKTRPVVFGRFEELIERQDLNLVVEAASQEAVKKYGRAVVSSGKNLAVMSVGAFTDESLFSDMKTAAEEKNVTIYIPSGAVAGVDGLKSANVGRIDSVVLTTRKSPASLGIDVSEETVLYDGPAREGIRRYPKNVNVAATLSLAGIGLDKTRLCIIADPDTDVNTHEVVVNGEFGTFRTVIENFPSPDNPKTSHMAILSAIATIRGIWGPVRIGT